MNKIKNSFTPDQKKALALEVYKKIKENKIEYKIKNMTVVITNSEKIDQDLFKSLVLCDPNELLRLCSQKVN